MFICAITSCILEFFVASGQSALRFQLRVLVALVVVVLVVWFLALLIEVVQVLEQVGFYSNLASFAYQ